MASGYTPKETLERLLEHLGLTAEVCEEQRPCGPTLHILTAEPSRLIGKNGRVLDDLQYLLNHVISSGNDDIQHVTVDVENYRQEQYAELLKKIAVHAARVKASGEDAVLWPMNSFDRRLVHHQFASDPDIVSVSEPTDARLKRVTLKRRTA
ncbi:MAG: single-stranded DNA-binding protein [Verrucomicrobiales bacterium]|jgi:spoIIIJ-associated protein|nr:single-stranded DNA-binding protein [Verrucomicrobiales bacterium]